MNKRIFSGVFALITLPLLLTGCAGGEAHAAAAAQPHPTVTVTVTADPVQTGVDQDTYDACKAAYAQMVGIAGKQTSILSGVSFAARDAMLAVSAGDASALSDATSKVQDYTSQEKDLTDEVNGMDKTVCQ